MKKTILINILFLFLSLNIFGQNNNKLEELKTQFQSFNYSKVINLADSLLNNKNQFSEIELIDIFLIKGISHYSLGQESLVKDSFSEILSLNSSYKINTTEVSPKIINEFEKLKSEYNRFISNNKSLVVVKTDTLYQVDTLVIKPNRDIYSATVIRSLALPGWGHIYSGHKTKGWIITSVSTITLGSMLYFIFDTSSKRSEYLNEGNPLLIEDKFNDYNASYKIRNSLIATYALIWIYTQIDILFLSDIPFVPEVTTVNIGNSPHVFPSDVQLSFHLQF